MAYQGKRSDVIYQAFIEAIGVLGEPAKRAIIEELQQQEIDLHNATLENLAQTLRYTISEDAAALIVQKVLRKLDDPFYKVKNERSD